ncbi:MAG: hypothetical protein OQL17_06400 [Sedimenticola sp.]|nr:hypothetical protein [Sedimenticola sp.]
MMAEDDLNEAQKSAEEATDPAPAKKAVRKKVPAKKAAAKKKVVAKKKAAPKKKAARKRSITPKQTITPPAEAVAAAVAEPQPNAASAEEINQTTEPVAETVNENLNATSTDTETSTQAVETDESVQMESTAAAVTEATVEQESATVEADTGTNRNENVQKRLEEMGLMPSDSTENLPPPAKTGGKGLGFWQKSFIWTIIVVAGLLYIRNVANNGDLQQSPEVATSGQSEQTDADKTTAETPSAPLSSDVAVTAHEETPAAAQEIMTPAANEPQQASTAAGSVPSSNTSGQEIASSNESEAASAADNSDEMKQDTEAQNAAMPVSDQKPEKLIDRITGRLSALMGDANNVDESKAVEEGAALPNGATDASSDKLSSGSDESSAKTTPELATTASGTPEGVGTPNPQTETEPPVETSGSEQKTDEPEAAIADSTNVDLSNAQKVKETPAIESVATTETEAAKAETSSSSDPTQKMPMVMANPANMPRMMQQGYRSWFDPNRRSMPETGQNNRAPVLNRQQVPSSNGMASAAPNVQQQRQMTPPTQAQRGYQRYGVPMYYPWQYNQQPVAPYGYYGTYPVRPPVYGPAVRYPYPYLQTPPAAPTR